MTEEAQRLIKQINDAHDLVVDIYTGRRLFSVDAFTRLEAAFKATREFVEREVAP